MPIPPIWPDHGRPGAVRSVDYGAVGHIDPFALKSDAVMAVLGFPIDIIEPQCIGAIAAGRFDLAREAHEPAVEFGTGDVVGAGRVPGEHAGHDGEDDDQKAADGARAVIVWSGPQCFESTLADSVRMSALMSAPIVRISLRSSPIDSLTSSLRA